MNAKTENSMMLALSELRNLETERLAEEAAARLEQSRREMEKRRKEEEERTRAEEQQRAKAEHEKCVAEAEARIRSVEVQRAKELEQRAEALEHALRVTKAEQGLLSAQLGQIEHAASSIGQAWRWRLVGAVSGCLVLAFSAVLIVGPKLRKVPPPIVHSTFSQAAVDEERKLHEQTAQTMRQKVKTLEEKLAWLKQQQEAQQNKLPVTKKASVTQPRAPQGSLFAQAKDCKDDPLCGIGGTSKPAK